VGGFALGMCQAGMNGREVIMRVLVLCILLLAGTAWAQGQPEISDQNEVPVQGHVVPGAEDGFFSAEDYRLLKDSREQESGETRSLVRTRDGAILIRKQETPNGPRYQVHDTRPGRRNDRVIVVPQ
jgi:hypothetical protein